MREKYNGIYRKVQWRTLVLAAVLLAIGLTITTTGFTISAEKNTVDDSSRNSLLAMQELTGQVQFVADSDENDNNSNSSKHSLLAMQALTGQVLQPKEQQEIATWQISREMGDIEESSGITKAEGVTPAQDIGKSGIGIAQYTGKPQGIGISQVADPYGLKGGEGGRDSEEEYADLAIAHVTDYVNVRSNPDTDSDIVGKIYNGAVAQILETAGENEEWFHVTSGSVEGYIKAEYFIYGDAAADVVDDYVTRYVVVQVDRLNVRESADISAKRIGYLDQGEKALLVEDCGDWMKVSYGGNKEGFVSSEFTTVMEEFIYAKSIEEEKAELEALRAQQKRQETSEEHVPENTTVTPPAATYTTDSELRSQIVDYAMQFLGNKYVSGGNSLTNGTDCSGFTSLIYADFGYSISRTPAGQLNSAGRSISYSDIQPGDIVCYGSSKCTHVGLYIGNGQIIHEANSRKGVVIYNADYDNILGVKNVID